MSELKPFDEFMDALVHCDIVKVILTGCGESTFETKPIHEGICALANRRAQPANEPCTDCSGIVYRQTNSGKIIPADQRCGAKITPPCYQPDGDGCAYQIYGDNNDEPIERCKACPLCYSDKVRHKDPANEPPVRCGECANYQTQNCAAEHMDKPVDSNMVYCYHGDEIVAIFDSTGITEAHFSDKEANG